jgi:hypothetical protein
MYLENRFGCAGATQLPLCYMVADCDVIVRETLNKAGVRNVLTGGA